MADIQSATAEIRRGKKKKETTGQKHKACPITQVDYKNASPHIY